MGRYSRRNRKGGDNLDDIQVKLDSIQQQLNELKGSRSSSMSEESMPKSFSSSMLDEPMPESIQEPMPESMPESMPELMEEASVKVDKSWVDDKNKKFNDGNGGRVSLAFSRIMTLIDNNIKKGDTKKGWSIIKEKLTDANSVGEVQDVINTYKVSFASNYVAGTRRRKRNGKKRTHKRR
jgi:hypothetical protein